MFTCPLCGNSSNRRGNSFETVDQVVAHIDGSHDPDHDGVSGEEARAEIEEVDSNDAPAENAPTGAAEPDRGAPAGDPERDTVGITEEELNDMLDTASEAGYSDGYKEGWNDGLAEGKERAQRDTGQNTTQTESAQSASGGSEHPRDDCPECGGELVDFREEDEWHGHETPVDYYCSECRAGFVDK